MSGVSISLGCRRKGIRKTNIKNKVCRLLQTRYDKAPMVILRPGLDCFLVSVYVGIFAGLQMEFTWLKIRPPLDPGVRPVKFSCFLAVFRLTVTRAIDGRVNVT